MVYVASTPIDLRLSFDRLAGIVREVLGHEPRAEAAFVFHNRARTHAKILWQDGRGYCLLYKRLDRAQSAARCDHLCRQSTRRAPSLSRRR
jgi:transposase